MLGVIEKMRKNNWFKLLAIISSMGILGWMITDFYGGMFIYLLSYPYIILPLLVLYAISLIETLISVIRKGFRESKMKIICHAIVLLGTAIQNLYYSDLFKSKRIVTATLKDDLFHYTLVLRENGSCENNISGMFGYTERLNGIYVLRQDTIIFTKKPYDNNFIPDTLLLDRELNAIFMEREQTGRFKREKEYLTHFEIE